MNCESNQLDQMRHALQVEGKNISQASVEVYGYKQEYYRKTTPEQREDLLHARQLYRQEKLEQMRQVVQQGKAVKVAAAAVYGQPRRYYRSTTPEQRKEVNSCKPCNAGKELRKLEQLARMRQLVQVEGKTVSEAATEVYGLERYYFRETTAIERETVYCKPKAVKELYELWTQVRPDVAERFEAACKAKGKSKARVLRSLVMEFIRLNPVEPNE